MASKNQKPTAPRASARAAGRADSASAESAGFALAQEQVQSMMALADLVLKRAEELRQCQLEAAQETRRRHDKARADIASTANPTELLHVQADLLRDDLESARQYWQRLASICTAAQADAFAHVTRVAAFFSPMAAGTAGPQANTEAVPAKTDGEDSAQAWNRWVDLGKQWSDMLYRTEAALH